MPRLRFAAAIIVAAAALSAPARAALPSFAGYFAGSWTCTTGIGGRVVKTYGAGPAANELLLFNPYVDARGFVHLITETYAQHGATVSAISGALGSTAVSVASGSGFSGDKLVFTGTLTAPNAIIYQRETYTRVDETHFTRTFERGRTADGPYQSVSSESCTRVAAAPVPTPSPPLHP